ncbi:hypothetical protein NE857_14280 [Nocardiopsis exhalans]|uniref:Uncharacterized protein n=1 Tax=Nocardiopsis exhalans TaxID=163604 RepID=A0ABY5DGP9_9ACTN|nr:hypothetical protein [Nocardiopsis exhalans]USY22668.1 hypothetical protein NE857_14280 [Nocardiopsis exhalans]
MIILTVVSGGGGVWIADTRVVGRTFVRGLERESANSSGSLFLTVSYR